MIVNYVAKTNNDNDNENNKILLTKQEMNEFEYNKMENNDETLEKIVCLCNNR